MRNITFTFLVFLFANFLFAGNRIAIPNKQISYSGNDIISNPSNGERYVYNQLLIVFDPAVNRSQQESILNSIDGKVVGGLPAFDIYQITFDNPNKSYLKLAQVQLELEKNGNILYAMPQKIENQSSNKTKLLLASSDSERSGNLNSKNLHRKSSKPKLNRIQDTINSHLLGLNACVERQNRITDSFHGKVQFVLVVMPNGNLKSARIPRSTVKDKQVTACMLKKVRKWRDFPKSKGTENRKVEFEFAF